MVFGGPSAEHDVSVITGLQATHSLAERGQDVVALYWSKIGEWWQVDPLAETAAFADGVPDGAEQLRFSLGVDAGFARKRSALRKATLDLDVIVNACHGGAGEDGTLQALLDLAGIPYTGPTRSSASLAMDKLGFASLLESRNLRRLPRISYADALDRSPDFPAPYIVKPRYGGSSIGTQVVEDDESLGALIEHGTHMRDGAVVEPFLPDSIDLNVGLRRFPELQVSAIERPLRNAELSPILGYADKYTSTEGMAGAPRELPADLPEQIADELRTSALTIGAQLPVRGVARLDFLLDGNDLYVNELNTIPGSFAKYLWIEPKIPFEQLLKDMIAEAKARPTYRPVTEGADGSILRDAGSIAAKLH